jgi:hypothetical protein
MTKSGQRGTNFLRCVSVRASHRSRNTQEASGERLALFGNLKPPDESNPTPVPSVSARAAKRPVSRKLRLDPSPPTGSIMIICPFHKMMTFTPSLHRGGFCFFARRSFAL